MREIGSEFHFGNLQNREIFIAPAGVDSCLVFSGRTAIETVLKNEPNIRKALLPSYCCDSMIEPFRRAGVNVDFYSVTFEEGLKIDLKTIEDVDCILWCNYFGFRVLMPELTDFIARGGIVIEDITHSFFSVQQHNKQSRYLVASLRKWEPILCGGYVESREGELRNKPGNMPSVEFQEKKKKAMKLKAEYLAGVSNIEKHSFLSMFSETNEWLAENYSGLTIDDYSKDYLSHVHISLHREQRMKNANVLYEGLIDNPNVRFLFSLDTMDCPLFVPVIINDSKRDAIRKKLIENDIYCPVHWPHPKAECESNLYEMELSLICDHRYNEKDMKRIVEVLNSEI